MKVLILVAVVTVCIVGFSEAAPHYVDQQGDGVERALLQSLLSRMAEKFADDQKLQQALLRDEETKEESLGCVCITFPCLCDKQYTGERENGFDHSIGLNVKKLQQKNVLLSSIGEFFNIW